MKGLRFWMLIFCLSTVRFAAAQDLQSPSGDAAVLPPQSRLVEIWNQGEFTEGVAVAADGTVYFSDIAFDADGLGRVLKYNPASGVVAVHCADSGKSNGLMFDRQGRLIACCGANKGRQAVCEVTADGKLRDIATSFRGKRFNSPNDLVIHPNGSIYFSDPRYVGQEPMLIKHQSVYRIDPNGKVSRVTRDIDKPNGVHLSPDGRILYVAETDNGSTDVTQDSSDTKKGRMTLNAFPIRDDGTLGDKRVLVNFGSETGTDGMSVDRQGNLYAAVRHSKQFGIVVYSPDGKQRARIPTPSLPTNCCFGRGRQATTLFVTAGGGFYKIQLKIPGHHPATAAR